MRHNLPYSAAPLAVVLLLGVVCASCLDDINLQGEEPQSGFVGRGNPVDVTLSISVGDLAVDAATRAEDPTQDIDDIEDTEEERHVDDLWIFVYDAESGEMVTAPQYLTITNQETLADLPLTLNDNYGNRVIIYAIANAGSGIESNSKDWAAGVTIGSGRNQTTTYTGFETLEELEAQALPTPHPQRLIWNQTTQAYELDEQDADAVSIPMAGSIETTVKEGVGMLIPVKRMFAKVMMRVDFSEFDDQDDQDVWLNTLTVEHIPEYCSVTPLGDSQTTDPADYTACENWLSRRFFNSAHEAQPTVDGDEHFYPYIIYIPENIQGENGSSTEDKAENIPPGTYTGATTDALLAEVGVYVQDNSDGTLMGPYTFTAYPGGNSTDNFNVRRNCVYRVTLKVGAPIATNPLPSANCIFCPSGETMAFWPYYRTEEGGGYEFEDYVDAYGSNEDTKIDHVEIIWQSTNGGNTISYSSTATGYIGNNSSNACVWIDEEGTTGDEEFCRRIHVKIPDGNTGNALIGAYNNSGTLIWSWHIWSRAWANDPTTVNTKLYYTYDWDSSGIYSSSPRVAGYTIMNCNLGAMQDEPNYPTNANLSFDNALPTFGTLYQWGRKDPFPPVRVQIAQSSYGGSSTYNTNPLESYDETRIGRYFDNANTSVSITGANTSSSLFHSVPGTERKAFDAMIPLTIQNPTVFYAGTNNVNQKNLTYVGGSSTSHNMTNYPSPVDGNWLLDDDNEHYNRLWGGLDPEHDQDKINKQYNTGITSYLGEVHLYDDYGSKSIFDPCPYGWRVSPPDLWLGFTSTGLNVSSMNNINYNDATVRSGNQTRYPYSYYVGMTMYMTAWKEGETSFFPCQGTRAPDGCALTVGQCGNYNNATADEGDRVNILHIHYSADLFKIFEDGIIEYFLKSTASPIRCVRETK